MEIAPITEANGVVGTSASRDDQGDAEHAGRAMFEAIVENGSDLIVITTADGKVTYVSPALTSVLGFSGAASETSGLGHLVHPDDKDICPRLYHEARTTGRTAPAEIRLRNAEGDWRTLEMTVVDLTDVPEVAGILWTSRDVTERRQLEDALSRAANEASDREGKLAEAQRLALLGSWEWDVERQQVTWSDELLRLMGVTSHCEPTVETIFEQIAAEDRDALAAAFARTLESGSPHAVDVRVCAPDGDIRWLNIRGTATRRDGDRVLTMSGTAQDITERRAAEAALRLSEERFRVLTETASDAIVSADAAGTILSFNLAAEQMFGWSTLEAIGSSLTVLMPVRFREAHTQGMQRFLAGGAPRAVGMTSELVGQHRSGNEFPIEVSLASWTFEDDTHFTGIIRDISARKAGEAEQRATNSLLSATLDSTADGILVTDLDGQVTHLNRQFSEMWNVPAAAVLSHHGRVFMDLARDQLVDPEGFTRKLSELHQNAGASSLDTLEFKDGRVFERYCAPQRVDGSISGRVWSFRDVTERKRLEDELAHQAFHDSLTNLANQALFRDRVDHALERSERRDTRLTVLFLDLDSFKTVNDSLGHPAGDEILVAASQRLGGCLRAGDTAARLGGDEFAVLLEETSSPQEAIDVAERIIAALRLPFLVGSKDIVVSASIGIAFAVPGIKGDQLLRNADLAMYTAKSRGRARYELFEPAMHRAVLERLEVEGDLRRACDRDEFVVYFQPLIELSTGKITSVEALVRWQHPVRGLLLPDLFIPVAEETGLIERIGGHVLRVACTQVRQWQLDHPGHAGLSASVNLSPRQLLDPHLIMDVVEALSTSGLAAADLTLEITEGAMMRDTDAAIRSLQALKSLGIQLAVDDFGIGHSSLSYLQRFPIDVLKIDKSFVWGMEGGPEESALAHAIVRLAQTLNLTAVAEGVETAGQASALRALGCDEAQGFYFARPIDAAALGRLLLARESDVA